MWAYKFLCVTRKYSVSNAEEALATLTGFLGSPVTDLRRSDRERVVELITYYPWAVEAWLDVYTPHPEMQELPESEGFNR